jgi:hypothetical protein
MATPIPESGIRSDADWIRQAFFVPGLTTKNGIGGAKIRDSESRGQRFSSAELKYTDTTPGGNFAINPRPQFTRYCDPKVPGINPDSRGMGEYYSEAIDDNAQIIHMQFGVPEYNSLTNFFGRFYDTAVGRLANTGDASDFTFFAGQVVGYVLTAPFQVVNSVINFVKRIWNFVNTTPYSRFYYMKPVMPMYWSTVSHLLNRIGVNMGIINGPTPDDVTLDSEGSATKITYNNGLSASEFEVLNRLLPDVMTSDGGIDVFAISTRAQRLANAHYKTLNGIEKDFRGAPKEQFDREVLKYIEGNFDPNPPSKHRSLPEYLNTFYKGGTIGQGVGADDPQAAVDAHTTEGSAADSVPDKRNGRAMSDGGVEVARAWNDPSMKDYFDGELADGAAFVSFAVDHEGSVSESFSNSFKSSDIADKLNSISSSGRSAYFNMAGGNVGDNTIVNGIESMLGGIKSFVQGALNSVGLGGLSALGGAAYVDIPEFWDSASADLPKSNYTIKLSSPYGNKLSILLNIYLPLCMLLAGALPRTTGKNSYTSPFLCSLYAPGRNVIKLGMIDSLSITRGDDSMGWSADGLPTSVEVSFSVVNLSKILHVPVSELAGPTDALKLSMLDEDTPFTDYMAVLGGLSLYDQYYITPRLKLAWRNQIADFERWFSMSHFASHFAGTETMANRIIGAVYRSGDR